MSRRAHGQVGRSDRGRQRRYLWSKNPNCHWCGQPTVLTYDGGVQPENLATIDHLRSRLHPSRREDAKPQERRRVLACWKCNHERGKAENDALSLDEKHRRAHPRGRNRRVGGEKL